MESNGPYELTNTQAFIALGIVVAVCLGLWLLFKWADRDRRRE